MAKATAISGWMLECASILEIKCELGDESGQKVSSSLNCRKGEGLGGFWPFVVCFWLISTCLFLQECFSLQLI